jgi:hypothetical protein
MPDTHGYSVLSSPAGTEGFRCCPPIPALTCSAALGVPLSQTGMASVPPGVFVHSCAVPARRSFGSPLPYSSRRRSSPVHNLIYMSLLTKLYRITKQREHSTPGTPQCGCSDRLTDNIALAQRHLGITSYTPVCNNRMNDKTRRYFPLPFPESRGTTDSAMALGRSGPTVARAEAD